MPPREISFADIPGLVGQELGVSDWLEIDQERVNRFAEATGDFQWIHVDVERANAEIGGPIAHGYLTMSLIPFLSSQIVTTTGVARGVNYGSNKVRFSTPVRVGKRVRMRQTVIAVEPRAGGLQVVSECAIEVEDERRPACIAETVSLLFGEGGRIRPGAGA